MIKLTARKRAELEATVARSSAPAGLVRRTRVVLLSADGESGVEIASRLDLTPEAVSRIRRRFRADGIAGLTDRPKTGRTDNKVPVATVEKVVQLAMGPPHLAVAAGRPGCLARPSGSAASVSRSCCARTG
ncbi:MAG: helix-turn-helix domain-containing protein [Deltaproteobacteria bacterium]|nr:helix-turn-helix domain-containing protein [Deltaproteobacteria bacterium]